LQSNIQDFPFQLATEAFWMEIRNNYIRIVDIVDMANTHFSVIIFVACFNNFYFVCFQVVGLTRLVVFLFRNSSSLLKKISSLSFLRHTPFFISKVYLWYAIAMILTRMFAVYSFASSVNVASILPLSSFLPTTSWNIEVT
jgi:hypothetical protein